MDANGDGLMDLVLGPNSIGKWSVLKNTGSSFIVEKGWATDAFKEWHTTPELIRPMDANGDGLMALYGLDGDVDRGCRQALSGAVEMLHRLDRLNQEEQPELGEPLRIGIGIHSGEAIVGRMGPPQSPIVSAIGDNVNVAARLESLTKTFNCNLVVSETTASRSGLDLSAFSREEAVLKGRREPIVVLTLTDTAPLAGQLPPLAGLI